MTPQQQAKGYTDYTKLDWPGFIHAALDDFGLSDLEFRVYCHVLRRAGRDGEYAEDSLKVAKSIGRKSRAPIEKALKALAAYGLIEPLGKRGRANSYRPTYISEWKRKSIHPKTRKSATRASQCSDMHIPEEEHAHSDAPDMRIAMSTKLILEVKPNKLNLGSTERESATPDSLSLVEEDTRVHSSEDDVFSSVQQEVAPQWKEDYVNDVKPPHRVTKAYLIEQYGEALVAEHLPKSVGKNYPMKYLQGVLSSVTWDALSDNESHYLNSRRGSKRDTRDNYRNYLKNSTDTPRMSEEDFSVRWPQNSWINRYNQHSILNGRKRPAYQAYLSTVPEELREKYPHSDMNCWLRKGEPEKYEEAA